MVDTTDLMEVRQADKVELGINMRAIAIPKRVLSWPQGEPGPRPEVRRSLLGSVVRLCRANTRIHAHANTAFARIRRQRAVRMRV